MESPYDVLRVDPDADEAEVKRAFRRRAKETHPDQGGSPAAFREVVAAYEAIAAGEGEQLPTSGADVDEVEEVDEGGVRGYRTGTRVEFLDYELLDDYGWSLDDDDLFEKASAEGLDADAYGELTVESGQTLLEAAEDSGFTWPYSCRGGACANCAVAVTAGEMAMSIDHVLPQEMVDRGIGLSCIGAPTTDELQVVYNVKHLPDVEDLLLPPGPFAEAHSDD